jgi:hypothetical protein
MSLSPKTKTYKVSMSYCAIENKKFHSNYVKDLLSGFKAFFTARANNLSLPLALIFNFVPTNGKKNER